MTCCTLSYLVFMMCIPVAWAECSDATGTLAGHYLDGNSQCAICPAGNSCPSGTFAKTECPPGTMQPLSGQTYCIDCMVNSFSSTVASTTCTACTNGSGTGVRSNNCSVSCDSDHFKVGNYCEKLEICDFEIQYATYGDDGQRSCNPISACNVTKISKSCSIEGVRMCNFRDSYITVRATATSDQSCRKHEQCQKSEYMYSAYLTGHDGIVIKNQICREYTTCVAGQFHIFNGREKEDRNNVCGTHTECELGVEYQYTAPDLYNDRVCALMTRCDSTSQYIHRRGSPYNDTVCAERTICGASSFQSVMVNDSTSIDINCTEATCQNYSTCTAGQWIFFVLLLRCLVQI
jgi:hypothetical protein